MFVASYISEAEVIVPAMSRCCHSFNFFDAWSDRCFSFFLRKKAPSSKHAPTRME
jgi:hypothetical protein